MTNSILTYIKSTEVDVTITVSELRSGSADSVVPGLQILLTFIVWWRGEGHRTDRQSRSDYQDHYCWAD